MFLRTFAPDDNNIDHRIADSAAGHDIRLSLRLPDEGGDVGAAAKVAPWLHLRSDGRRLRVVAADTVDGDGCVEWQMGRRSRRCRVADGHGVPAIDRRTDPSPAYRDGQAGGYAVSPVEDRDARTCRHHTQPAGRNDRRRGVRRSRQRRDEHLPGQRHCRRFGYCHTECAGGSHHLHAYARCRQLTLALVHHRLVERCHRTGGRHHGDTPRLGIDACPPLHAGLCRRCHVVCRGGGTDTGSLCRSAQQPQHHRFRHRICHDDGARRRHGMTQTVEKKRLEKMDD